MINIHDALEALAILIGFCGLLFLSDTLDIQQPASMAAEQPAQERAISWDQQQLAHLAND